MWRWLHMHEDIWRAVVWLSCCWWYRRYLKGLNVVLLLFPCWSVSWFASLLPGCLLISSTFDQTFCSSLFDFLTRLSWGFTPGFLVVVGCMSTLSPVDLFRGRMCPWRCPSGLVVIVGVPCGLGERRSWSCSKFFAGVIFCSTLWCSPRTLVISQC